MTDDIRTFAEEAVRQAGMCISEPGRISPCVGAVAVREGKILAAAYRGELAQGEHAEFTLLERKLQKQSVAGATILTTLEPCTNRNHPKLPCVDRLVERKVGRVVIGMLDPNYEVRGRGQLKLRDAGIATEFFPADLMATLEELNREFIREQRKRDHELARALYVARSAYSIFPTVHALADAARHLNNIDHQPIPVAERTPDQQNLLALHEIMKHRSVLDALRTFYAELDVDSPSAKWLLGWIESYQRESTTVFRGIEELPSAKYAPTEMEYGYAPKLIHEVRPRLIARILEMIMLLTDADPKPRHNKGVVRTGDPRTGHRSAHP